MRHDKYKISDALKTGPATELFDFIAQCVEGFIATLGTQDKKETNEPLYLGFTFSFPVQQTALDKGTLISWTKVGSSLHSHFLSSRSSNDHTTARRASLVLALKAMMSFNYFKQL